MEKCHYLKFKEFALQISRTVEICAAGYLLEIAVNKNRKWAGDNDATRRNQRDPLVVWDTGADVRIMGGRILRSSTTTCTAASFKGKGNQGQIWLTNSFSCQARPLIKNQKRSKPFYVQCAEVMPHRVKNESDMSVNKCGRKLTECSLAGWSIQQSGSHKSRCQQPLGQRCQRRQFVKNGSHLLGRHVQVEGKPRWELAPP